MRSTEEESAWRARTVSGHVARSRSAGRTHEIFRISAVPGCRARCPFTHKVLLENLLRTEDGANVTADQIRTLGAWDPDAEPTDEIQFTPARVIMQDFTGVPVRGRPGHDARGDEGPRAETRRRSTRWPPPSWSSTTRSSPTSSAPTTPRPATSPWSTSATASATSSCAGGRRRSTSSRSCRPSTGIVHQVNIEALARVVMVRNGQAYPDTCVGTDSHTTMVNGLGVLGLGRRRHRGRGRDARPAGEHADPAGRRLQADRRAARRARPPPTWC